MQASGYASGSARCDERDSALGGGDDHHQAERLGRARAGR